MDRVGGGSSAIGRTIQALFETKLLELGLLVLVIFVLLVLHQKLKIGSKVTSFVKKTMDEFGIIIFPLVYLAGLYLLMQILDFIFKMPR